MSDVFTHRRDGENYGYKLCQCQRCGLVAECSPETDFFATADDIAADLPAGAPLYCETCFYVVTGMDGLPSMEMPAGPFEVGDLIEGKKDGRRMVVKITEVDDDGDPMAFEEVG